MEELRFSKKKQTQDLQMVLATSELMAELARQPLAKFKTGTVAWPGSTSRENKHQSIRGEISLGGKTFYMRSAWERNYARYLQLLKEVGEIKDWTYEPQRFDFPERRGNNSYLPDFLITRPDGMHYWVEIKGYMSKGSRTKIKRFMKYYPAEKLLLLDKDQYRKLAKDLKKLVPGWE